MLGCCCDPKCKTYLRDPSLKGGAGKTVQLTFNFPDQTFRSTSYETEGGTYHSWRVTRNYTGVRIDLYVSGDLEESKDDNNPLASASPTWDRELDFTGVDPVDGIVRTWRTGPCSHITLKSVDPCNTVGNPVQTGNITYKVYRESDKELITTITSDSSGKAIVFGLKDEEDYRVTAGKPGCGTGVYKIVDLEYGEEYDVPLGCSRVRRITISSPCTGQNGTSPPFGFSNLLPGTTVTLTKAGTDHWIKGTTDGNAQFAWTPPEGGAWQMTISHPSGGFRAGGYNISVDVCSTGGNSVQLVLTPGNSCCACGCIRSPLPIKLPLLCVTDTGASWTQGSGTSCDGGTAIPVLVDRMGPKNGTLVQCYPWCSYTKEPDGLSAGMINVGLGVGIWQWPATLVTPPQSGSVSAGYSAAWSSTQWPADEACESACRPGPKDQKWSAWWWSDPGITSGGPGGGQQSTRWELLSAKPFMARVYFDDSPIASYQGMIYADGTNDGKAPLPRAIKFITVSEGG